MTTIFRRRALMLAGLLSSWPVTASLAGDWAADADAMAQARQRSLIWGAVDKARPCAAPPQLHWVQGGGVLRIGCTAPAPGWSHYVPARVAGRSQTAASARTDASDPPVIQRGDPVDVTVTRAGLSVTLRGAALEAARKGARFRLRTGARGTVMTVEAVAAGQARLPDLRSD